MRLTNSHIATDKQTDVEQKSNNIAFLKSAFADFFIFSPRRQSLIITLTLLQGFSAGIGLLFILPLLQIVGFKLEKNSQTGLPAFANNLFTAIGLELNLINILASYIFIVTIVASLRFLLTTTTASVQQAYIRFIRIRLYRSLLHTRWQFIVQHKMSDFIHSLTGQVQSMGHAANLMVSLLSQAVLTLIMLLLAFFLSWQMTLLSMLIASALLILLLPLNRIIYGSGIDQLVNFKSIFQMLSEQLASLKMIKSYASENYYADKLDQASDKLEAQHVKLTQINATTQWVYMVGAVIAFSIFFYIAQVMLAIPLATNILLLVIFSRLLPQISGLQKTYQQILHKIPAFNDVNKMLALCTAEQELGNRETPCPELNHSIRLDGIYYRHPGSNTPVLQNFTLNIEKNQTIALVGPSGVGKSTLADLIAGLLEPDAGTIYCDDLALEGDRRLAWRQRVAYVTQEIYLFHDSIRANLNWVANSEVTDDELWRALHLAAASEFVKRLPAQLNTVIGDQGIRLSGGERQRLALARALLAQPQLLILDEATSALDEKNERLIQLALEQLQGQVTILIIAHRNTTLKHADKCIDLIKTTASKQI